MRNLKKILALVLALVMSLSLMATAGASQFPDVDESNPYATAIDVLDELKVFQGFDDGTFKPTETLNRAQAAVLVYRIATGDVENKYLDNYTFMQQSKFTDLDGYNWAKGYINYCQNAGIVVGTSATTFDPGAKVTGYQLLVMLLRTLGYGKAGEFADPKGWELQTATIAEREGITKNITAGDFGAPAPRQMVAEILFRGLLSESVEYSALIPGGYTKTGVTLGMREFGLEQISGVVMANEWANLNEEGDKVLKAGVTEMKLEDGKTYTVNKTTDLDAVGLNYKAYVADGEDGVKRALTLEPGANTVYFNEGEAVANVTKAKDAPAIVDATEYYLNYAQDWDEDCTSDYQIGYVLNWNAYFAGRYANISAANWDTQLKTEGVPGAGTLQRAAYNKEITRDEYFSIVEALEEVATPNDATASNVTKYTRSIRPDQKITVEDRLIMQYIFYVAGRFGDNPEGNVQDYSIGEVYVGTTERKDYSDEMSWKAFKEEYFNDTKTSRRYADCEQGNSLRIIDNNGDGKAEYVLKIAYTQDQVVGTYKDAPLLNSLQMHKYTDNNLYDPDEIGQGDVVNYYVIDNKLSIWKADIVTDSIKTKSFKDVTVTTTEGGETYDQSGITNETGMDQDIMQMANKTQYNMYLDEFGNIRSYALAQGSKYALLTEMYPTSSQNHNYVRGFKAIAEMKIGEDDTAEHPVANSDGSVFFSPYIWTFGYNGYYGVGNTTYSTANYLQPAIAHLGTSYVQVATNGAVLNSIAASARNHFLGATNNLATDFDTSWERAVARALTANYSQNGTPVNRLGVFDYGAAAYKNAATNGANVTAPSSFSFTNVAAYTLNDDGSVNLSTASKLALSPVNGQQIYRVGSAAVTAAGKIAGTSDDVLPLYTNGTRDDLVALYMKNAGANKTAAEAFIDSHITSTKSTAPVGSNLDNGTDIYPVFANDYVQLDLVDNAVDGTTVVKSGMRHYNITTGYNTNYNTNSNSYVDATVDTEFYIVMPKNILYKVGYADLPTIKAEEIRAAYAVAHNTSAQSNGQDYWVADVIVIETTGLANDFDSIALAYYNPYEVNDYTRYVDSLNNEWNALQPGLNAMMQIVPKEITGSDASTGWGNHAWMEKNDFGFYKLYDTELESAASDDESAGALDVGEMVKITSDYNKYGIYAGTVTRVQDLQKSQYMDVDTYNTGAGANQENLIRVYYGEYDVPFYRVYTDNGVTYAELLELNAVESVSDVKKGDKIIWVYNKAQNQLSFAIDVTSVKDRDVPAWLYDSTGGVNSLWEYITDEQDGATATVPVSFDINLSSGESAEFIYNGRIVGNPSEPAVPTTTPPTPPVVNPYTVSFDVSASLPTFSFQIKTSPTVAITAIDPTGALWKMTGSSVTSTATENTYTIYMTKAALVPATLAATQEAGTIYTLKAMEALIDDAETMAAAVALDPTKADEAAALLATVEAVKGNQVNNADLPAGATKTALETAKTDLNTVTDPATDGSLANEVGAIADADALETAKTEAKAAITTMINGATGGDIAAKQTALETAIDNCDNMGQLEAYYKNGALVATQSDVVALQLAIDKVNAKAAVTAMVGNTVGVDTEKGAVDDAIDACTTAAQLEAIYKNGALVTTQTQVAALKLAVDKVAAKAAVTAMVGDTVGVDTEKGAVDDAIDACTTAAQLEAIYKNGALVTTQTQVAALKLAVDKVAAKAAVTAMVGDTVGVDTEKGAVDDAIDACTTAAELEAIYKDGALVATNQKVIDLQTAIDAAG